MLLFSQDSGKNITSYQLKNTSFTIEIEPEASLKNGEKTVEQSEDADSSLRRRFVHWLSSRFNQMNLFCRIFIGIFIILSAVILCILIPIVAYISGLYVFIAIILTIICLLDYVEYKLLGWSNKKMKWKNSEQLNEIFIISDRHGPCSIPYVVEKNAIISDLKRF